MKNKDEKLYRADAVTVPKLLPISKEKEQMPDQQSKETISKRNESSKSK